MSRYSVGFDPIDSKKSEGVFVVFDRKKNNICKIINTRFIKLWLFIYKLRGITVLQEK